ncbi:MAG: hypothetical protein ACI9OH_001855 [Oleispira sp.]|jgi:hypothetical protein
MTILFLKTKKCASRILLASIVMGCTLLQGCACPSGDDTCHYEPGIVALWSDNNEKLAVVVTDYGDSKSDKDNSRSIATVDLDGRNISHVKELDSEQSLGYYSALKNYMILSSYDLSGLRIQQYQRLDLNNLNLETLVTNEDVCIHRHVIPSLDGAVLGIIEIAGQENGFYVNNDPDYSATRYHRYSENADSNAGCNKLTMKVTLVDVDTNETITEFLNVAINLPYYVSLTNSMSVPLNMYWSNQGVIINTHSQDEIYSIFNSNGSTAIYDLPPNCYPLATSSSDVSQENIRAKAHIILDNGIYSKNNKVELTDLSDKASSDFSWQDYVPTVGQEICVL